MKRILLFYFFISSISLGRAQQCPQFPADCPNMVLETEQDSLDQLDNLIVPQELHMALQLNRIIEPMMERIGKVNKWEMYYLGNGIGAGIGVKDKHEPLPYPLRPPFECSHSYVFIINQDSLKAWKSWFEGELRNKSSDVLQSYQQASTDISQNDRMKAYMDSAKVYTDKETEYANKHASEYQAALLSNNQKGIKAYEDGLKKIQDRIDYFINRINGQQSESISSADSKEDKFQEYRSRNMRHFRSASILLVTLDFNTPIWLPSEEDDLKQTFLNLPGATLAAKMYNLHPLETTQIDKYRRSSDFAIVLLGKWVTKPDKYTAYHSSFTLDPANTDVVTPKKYTCDKVRTMGIHVEGNKQAIDLFLKNLDINLLNDLIVK